jgi:putative tryptophan/tyrosine transport system substrate-binding protein
MQFDQLNRRSFLTLLGGAAAAWPQAARAQQSIPVIGLLNLTSPEPQAHAMTAFRAGLQETGYVEGQNVTVEYRWADGRYDLLPSLAAELVSRPVTVVVAIGGSRVGRAAMTATSTIPIVFVSGADPIKVGLVPSLNRPGGNATGVHLQLGVLDPKKLGLLRELAPQATLVGVLLNPNVEDFQIRVADVQEAARTVGLQIDVLRATTDSEIDAAFAALSGIRAGALVVSSNAFFNARREQIVALAARHAIPAIYDGREYAAAGGLVSYGTSLAQGYRQAGIYTARILKGTKPADLPVFQVTKFEFVINMKTAKAQGVTISDNLLSLADEVIE